MEYDRIDFWERCTLAERAFLEKMLLVLSPGSRYLLLQTLQTLPAFVTTYQAMECFLHLGFHRLRNSNTWHYDGVLCWLYIYIYWSILTIVYLYCTYIVPILYLYCTIIIHNHYIQYYNQLFECFSMYTIHALERLESMNPVLRLFNVSNPTGQLGFEDWQSLYVDLSRYVRIKMFWLATLISLVFHISCYQHWFCL